MCKGTFMRKLIFCGSLPKCLLNKCVHHEGILVGTQNLQKKSAAKFLMLSLLYLVLRGTSSPNVYFLSISITST